MSDHKKEIFILSPGKLKLSDLRVLINDSEQQIKIDEGYLSSILASENLVNSVIRKGKTKYGINTGFGSLANTKIEEKDLSLLQEKLVLSHATGTGPLLSEKTIRLILALKINSLARGYSGIRFKVLAALISLFNHQVYPCIPSQGSVGASGDLAPLAHMSATLLGIGEVSYQGKIIPASQGLKIAGLEPITFSPKEGLALLNGTQVSTALALLALFESERLFFAGLIGGALSVDATLGSIEPFYELIHQVRGHPSQILVARILKKLLSGSEINLSHRNCNKIQDAYSLRCQPQVMGACLANILFVQENLLIEANAVTDNPLIFSREEKIVSGGNFHAEPVAFAADILALSIAEIGALSERRIALLTDKNFSNLPAFLVKDAGLNSGFMIAHVTAASLASENKSLAHPSSVDSIPTSANQEDHVSMATYAARRLMLMVENTQTILAIELLAGCQGIDFRRPLKTSDLLEHYHSDIRQSVSFYDSDRFFAPDINKVKSLLCSELFYADIIKLFGKELKF